MSIAHVSDSSFQSDVIESEVPVLVDFWAEWCSPCKMIGPILEELAPEYAGRVNIAKIDVDANPKTPQAFGIRSIPTLILFKNGVVEAQQVGAVSKKQLEEFLEKSL
ncbi:MAG: thioredoxin TrxA [Gammaproteobacteria bacterium]|jgi:thioredoxin 1|nr:thioredoxin TrxA [Gammaproteobacteria bacterium]